MCGKLLQRSLSFLMVLVLLFSVIPLNQAQATERPSEDEIQWLFRDYPHYIKDSPEIEQTKRQLFDLSFQIVKEQDQIREMSILESIMAIIKGKDKLAKEWNYAASEAFYLAAAEQNKQPDGMEAFAELFDLSEGAIPGAANIAEFLSEAEVLKLLEQVEEKAIFADLIDNGVITLAQEAVALLDYTVTVIALYECEIDTMHTLLRRIEKAGLTDGMLYQGLQEVYQNISNNPMSYIKKKYIDDMRLVEILLDVALGLVTSSIPPLELLNSGWNGMNLLYSEVIKMPSAEELTKAIYYQDYYTTIATAMTHMEIELIEAILEESTINISTYIEDYEILYHACNIALEKYSDSAKGMEVNISRNQKINRLQESLITSCGYDIFIAYCVQQAKEYKAETTVLYRYHMYVNEEGKRSVCPSSGEAKYPGTTFVVEYTDWMEEPLKVDNGSYSYYQHTRVDACTTNGCLDDTWKGDRYIDEEGRTWVCQEIKTGECEHNWGWERVRREPTCGQIGVSTTNCALCGEVRAKLLPTGGHNYQNGVCTHCGEGRGIITDRLDQLCAKLEGVYFTTTGKSCGNSNCDACAMKNVVKTERIAELFDGFVPDESVVISHDYGKNNPFTNGWSCCGFANFAGWYLFAENTKDSVDFNCICPDGKPVAFTEEGLKAADVKPGDLLRLSKDPALGAKGHSAVFVDFTENGILILDCNMRLPGDGYCRIRTHELKYGEIYSYICVSRADNYDQIVEETPEEDGEFKTQYRYHMYVNENGKRFVCPYAGQLSYPGTTFEIQYTQWLDAPLTVDNGSYTHYIHTRTEQCEDYGCQDASWEGNRYRDGDGLTWACQETQKVPVEEKYQWGDANGDGEADYSDALAVLRFSIGLGELSSEAQKACDVDGNPGLNYNDALTILRRSIGLE